MKRTDFRQLCCICMLVWLAACGRGEQRSTVPTGAELTGSGPAQSAPQPQRKQEPPNSCDPAIALERIDRDRLPDSIVVAEITGDSCPQGERSDAGEWITRTLYPTPGREPRDRPIQKRICHYLWKSPSASRPQRELLPPTVITAATVDPPVLALQAGDAEDYFEPLHKLARLRWNVPDNLSDPDTRGMAIRVAVLDTAETVYDSRGERTVIDANGHGLSIGEVVKTLACAGNDKAKCNVEIVYYPALAFRTDGLVLRGPQRGAGSVGTRGALAAEIRQATDDWLSTDPARRTPLIINLSLGWSGCYADRVGSEMVRSALAYATCQGALVLAAGGNGDVVNGCPNSPASNPEDPTRLHMFPGLWGGDSLKEYCQQEQLPQPSGPSPLVVGIGAVDYRDHQLSFTNHESDLVAYGQAVAMHSGESPAWMASGGTSLSVAAVSGMAALALRYKPDLPAFELFNKLYEGSVVLRDRAPTDNGFICNRQFQQGCDKPKVNRLSVCKLLREVAGVNCTVLEQGVPSEVPELKSRAALPTETVGKAPKSCGPPGAPPDPSCIFGSAFANVDNRDKPWCDGQSSAPRGCTCSGPDTPSVAGSFLAQVNPNKVYLEVKFTIAVAQMKLVVLTDKGEQRFQLGGAAADQLRRWRFDIKNARTAKVEYELPDGSLEVSDVRLWYDWSPP